MKVPCLFFGLKSGGEVVAVVEPRPFIFFPKLIVTKGREADANKSGEGWVVFAWDSKMLRYQYALEIFKDDVAAWLKQRNVSISDIGEEGYPPELVDENYQIKFGSMIASYIDYIKE